jgi:hypothetical protein
MTKKFIAKAIHHKGALTKEVLRVYGNSGFTSRGTIKLDVLHALASSKCPTCAENVCICPTMTTQKRARLALTLRRLNR